jgi:ABC-type uncharacterized transport system permease subunit
MRELQVKMSKCLILVSISQLCKLNYRFFWAYVVNKFRFAQWHAHHQKLVKSDPGFFG